MTVLDNRTPTRSDDPKPLAGLDFDEPLIDEETWQKAGRALMAANDDEPA